MNFKDIRILNLGYPSSVSVISSLICFIFVSLVFLVLSVNISVKASGLTEFTVFAGPQTNNQALSGIRPASVSGRYLAGRYAHRSSDYMKAAEYLGDVLAIDEGNLKVRRVRFLSLIGSGQMPEAAIIAKNIVAAERGDAIAILCLIVEDALEGRFALAEKKINSIPKRGVNRFAAPLLLAWIKSAQGDLVGAVKAIHSVEEITAFKALRNLHLGLIYEQAAKTELAEQALKEAAESSVSVRTILRYGSFLERQGRRTEAERVYKSHIQKYPSDVLKAALKKVAVNRPPTSLVATAKDGIAEVFFNLAGTLAQAGSSDLALIYSRLALRLRPSFPLAQLLLGDLLESLSRGADAITLYSQVSPNSSLYWSARLRWASVLDEIGRTEEAISLLKQMAADRKDRFEPHTRIGDLYRSKKKFEKAINAYNQGIKRISNIDESHWSLLYARGIAFERTKKWKNAEVDFLHALELSPEQPLLLNYLGYSWVDRGINLRRAKNLISRAVELRPNDGYIVDSLGWVLYRLGDFAGATKNLERAIILRPEDPTINDHLGDAYWRVGRKFEARFQWKRVLSLDPEKELIPIIRKKIRDGLKKQKDRDKGS